MTTNRHVYKSALRVPGTAIVAIASAGGGGVVAVARPEEPRRVCNGHLLIVWHTAGLIHIVISVAIVVLFNPKAC